MLTRLISKQINNLNVRFHLLRRTYKVTSAEYKKELAERKMKFLNVAEKNDAAKNIAAHLSRGNSRRREGLSQYNKIYEFDGEVMGQQCQMVMTSVSGHLLALEFVGAFKSWQSCNPLQLFEAPVFKYCPENYEKIKKTLEREVRSCDGLIIWTDCDREGENIGFEIIQVCTAVKNNLRIYRAKFSEITSISVRRALSNLEQPNKNISDAVDVRQELDLRIGAAFTRFQTLRLQKVFPTKLADSLVSYGSCQFPTLGFVVERYRAVENFVAEPFWKIKVKHTINDLTVEFAWDRIRLFDRDACMVLHEMCQEAPQAIVMAVNTKPKSKWRPLPLDTVELEKQGSRKLKINAKETMRIAEKLYTQGLISYPRTETNEFPREMNLAQLVSHQTGDPNWGQFAQGILDNGGPSPRQGNKSDKAHPPIHPTKYSNGLNGNEARLYEFIVRSFLACCSRDAQGQETSVAIKVAEEKFTASGLVITQRNYLEVYPYDKWSSKEIHHYQTGQTFDPSSIDMVDGNTSPPNLLTEADLIALMEKHGIGTDATHAEHIETIKSRAYVALADAIHFVPGLLGMGLVEGYDAMGLSIAKPHLRARLEQDLKDISEGRKNPQQVLAEQIVIYKEVYQTVTAEAEKIDQALGERLSERPSAYTPSHNAADITPVLKCPKCGSDMVVRQKKSNADEFYIGCLSFPNCKNAVWLPTVVRSLEVLNDTCATCGPNYKKIKFQWRNNSISHLYPPPHEGCLGCCDLTFLELMKINLACVRNVPESSRPRLVTQTGHQTSNQQRNTTEAPRQNRQLNSNTTSTIFNSTHQNQVLRSSTHNANVATRQFVPPTPVNRSQNTTTAMRMATPFANGNGDENNVLCTCNVPAILLTVRKQTSNFGKKFYKCQQGKENGGCDFFLWAPESVDAATNPNPYVTPPSSSWGTNNTSSNPSASGWGLGNTSSGLNTDSANTTRGWGIAPSRDSFPSNDDNISCNCGLPCKKITVHKEGPNKGRLFYACPKDFNSRCNFFQWADEAGSASDWGGGGGGGGGFSTGRGGNGARGRGRPRGEGAARGGPRKCGHCRQEGHTKNKCPNLQSDF